MQQVNLYLPELRPKNEWLTANTLALCILGAVILGVTFYILGRANNLKLEKSIVELEQLQRVSRAQIDSIKSMKKLKNTSEIDQKIQRLRETIRNKENVGKIIEYQNLGNAEGFSGAMEAVAQHSKNTIELHEISFAQGGRYLCLKGRTNRPKDIARYIEQLSDDPAFAKTQFGALQLNQLKQHNLYEFSLGENLRLQIAADESLQ